MATIAMGNALEVIRFTVTSDAVDQFLQKRVLVDAFLRTLEGFGGAELMQTGETDWIALVHWSSEETALAAQKITATASVISDWIAVATAFVSFSTAVVRYETGFQ